MCNPRSAGRRRLLLLCEYSTLNGGEQSMLSTLDTVSRAGYAIIVACPETGSLSQVVRSRGFKHVPFETHGCDGRRFAQDDLRRHLGGLLRDVAPDLIHANSLATGRLSGPVAEELGIPSIAHLRDIIGLSRKAIEDLNRHRRLLAVSDATREFHVGQGLDPERTHVLYNGVDLERFRPGGDKRSLRAELGLPEMARIVVTVGQLGLRKGLDVLTDAAIRVSAGLLHVHWLVVGERFSDKEESRQFEADLREAAAGPLKDRMRLLGWRDDVDRILAAADLLVHPARQEPLGRILLEAAASGLPTVATDVGGTREIFPSDDDGALLVPAGDSPALAEAIVRVLTDDALRDSMGRSIRRRAEAAFDAGTAATRLVEHYNDVVSGNPRIE